MTVSAFFLLGVQKKDDMGCAPVGTYSIVEWIFSSKGAIKHEIEQHIFFVWICRTQQCTFDHSMSLEETRKWTELNLESIILIGYLLITLHAYVYHIKKYSIDNEKVHVTLWKDTARQRKLKCRHTHIISYRHEKTELTEVQEVLTEQGVQKRVMKHPQNMESPSEEETETGKDTVDSRTETHGTSENLAATVRKWPLYIPTSGGTKWHQGEWYWWSKVRWSGRAEQVDQEGRGQWAGKAGKRWVAGACKNRVRRITRDRWELEQPVQMDIT